MVTTLLNILFGDLRSHAIITTSCTALTITWRHCASCNNWMFLFNPRVTNSGGENQIGPTDYGSNLRLLSKDSLFIFQWPMKIFWLKEPTKHNDYFLCIKLLCAHVINNYNTIYW